MKFITFGEEIENISLAITNNMQIVSKLAMCIIKMKNNEKYGFRGKFNF